MQWAQRINELILSNPLLKLFCLILFSLFIIFALVILSMLIVMSSTTEHVFLEVIMSLLLSSNKLLKSLIPISFRKSLTPLCSFFALPSHMFFITLSYFLKLFIQVIRVVVLIIRVFIAFTISKRGFPLVTLLVLLVFIWLLCLLLVLMIKRVWIRTKRILSECTHLIIFLFLFYIAKHIIGDRNLFKFSFS